MTWSFRRHHRASGGDGSQTGNGFDYEHEHRRKRLSTNTIGNTRTDERNLFLSGRSGEIRVEAVIVAGYTFGTVGDSLVFTLVRRGVLAGW